MIETTFENNERGVLTTFYATLSHAPKEDEIDEIVIPIVQRDYAQGRPSAAKIRKRFLKCLFRAIDKKESEPIELDFIYGDLKMVGRRNVFYPLDGQQRLTTLFLLHWLIAKRIQTSDVRFLEAFSYETRESSKLFCKKLVQMSPDFKIPIDEYIKDLNWFNSTWASDPTIASMLVMLREIYDHYENFTMQQMSDVWNNLVGTEDSFGKIRFYRLYLKDIGASDNLYIKMNSRGKPLTDFEHFKAELGRYTGCSKNFILKVDTDWTNLLWTYRDISNDDNKNKYEDNDIDKMLLRLIRCYLTIIGIEKNLLTFNEAEHTDDFDLLDKILGTQDASVYIGQFETIMDFFVSQMEQNGSIRNFFNLFLTEKRCSTKKIFLNADARTNIDIIYSICKLKITLNNIIFLEAFFQCALKYHGQPVEIWRETFKDRVRIIRNLTVNATDQIRNDKMHEILKLVDDIVNNGINERETAAFTRIQRLQELRKLQWIGNDQLRRDAIYMAENHPLLYGNLKVLETVDGYCLEMLEKFTRLFSEEDKMDLITCAMLSIGDYGNYVNSRLNYGGRKLECNSEWRNSVFINNNTVTPPILQELLNRLKDCSETELNAIVDDFLASCEEENSYTWTYYLVRYPDMRHGESAKYFCPDLNHRYENIMMNKTQFNGNHWNPFLYTLRRRIKGSTMSNYGGPLILPGGMSELTSCQDHFNLSIVNEGDFIIKIPQNAYGIDTQDRIQMIITQDGEDMMQHLKNLCVPK